MALVEKAGAVSGLQSLGLNIPRKKRTLKEIEEHGGILLRNIPAVTGSSDVNKYFSRYGIVKKSEILHTEDVMHTRCCVLYMQNASKARLILRHGLYIINDYNVTAEMYKGNLRAHIDLPRRGEFKLEVRKIFINKGDRGVIMLREVESVFCNCLHTGIELTRAPGVDDVFTGAAKIRFKTYEDRLEAIKIAKAVGWKVKLLPGRFGIVYKRRRWGRGRGQRRRRARRPLDA